MTDIPHTKKKIVRLLIILLFITYPIKTFSQQELNWYTPPAITSLALHEEMPYRVLLPDGYAGNPEKNYPLLLLLDGARYGSLVATQADFLAEIGEIPEHVIVAVNAVNRLRDYSPTDSPYWEGDGGAPVFLEFIKNELLPELEKNYRIKDELRIIWGHSAAGLFAMYTLYASPGLFDAHLVNDGSLDWDDKVVEHNLKQYFTQPDPGKVFLYFNSSYLRPVDDPELIIFNSMNSMLQDHAPASLRWIYDPLPTETHSSIPMSGSIRGLRALYQGYLVSEEVMFEGFDAVVKHYDAIRGEVGAPDTIPENVFNYFGYLMLGQSPEEAVAAFEMATQLYPSSANAWDSLSDAYLEVNRFGKALEATDKSIALAKAQGSEQLEYYQEKRTAMQKQIEKGENRDR